MGNISLIDTIPRKCRIGGYFGHLFKCTTKLNPQNSIFYSFSQLDSEITLICNIDTGFLRSVTSTEIKFRIIFPWDLKSGIVGQFESGFKGHEL